MRSHGSNSSDFVFFEGIQNLIGLSLFQLFHFWIMKQVMAEVAQRSCLVLFRFRFSLVMSCTYLLKVFHEGGLPSKVVFHQRSSSIISYPPSKSVFSNWCWNVSIKCRAQYLSYLKNIASSLFCFVFCDLDNFRLSLLCLWQLMFISLRWVQISLHWFS